MSDEETTPPTPSSEAFRILQNTMERVNFLLEEHEALTRRLHLLACENMAMEAAVSALIDVHPNKAQFRKTFTEQYELLYSTLHPDHAAEIDGMAQRFHRRARD